ncbi:hypothetical protein [Salinarchaeum sp. Harcht-Bsk1]|uniref:hypothetical protein n=1 Tax=Salinarchaeum sp. Harcht-Bsk1 TaxID=1333523 RepID=UPI0006778BA1|nr:hypothetical protein [Salinarchaeum sp. Harcht-Bsk1]
MRRSRAGSGNYGSILALIGVVSYIGAALSLLAIFMQGYPVALSGGSVSEIQPYIVAMLLLMVSVSIPTGVAALSDADF